MFDLIVIGGGPAGLTAALTAADVGKSVAIVDGTPTKQVQFVRCLAIYTLGSAPLSRQLSSRLAEEQSSIWVLSLRASVR